MQTIVVGEQHTGQAKRELVEANLRLVVSMLRNTRTVVCNFSI